MLQHVVIDQVIEAAPARVVVTEDSHGVVQQAAFDLTGLPRVDAFLVGRPVAEVPDLVQRLCGICPWAHHLAGVRALEALAGLVEIPPTAMAVRRLLHYAGVISIHAVSWMATQAPDALVLRRFAKAAMTAAGSPGHFPVTARPGGVEQAVEPGLRDACAAMVAQTLAAARRLAESCLNQPSAPDSFRGSDVALVDDRGALDMFGSILRAVASDGSIVASGTAEEWDLLVAEALPGSPAPRPYLVGLGSGQGGYRVGPVAQLRVGQVSTPEAATLQQRWRQSSGGAGAARAIITLHAVETIAELLEAPPLVSGPTRAEWSGQVSASVGVGMVDATRGLLVHRYVTDEDARVADATILTPTAQNEPWLGELLHTAATTASLSGAKAAMEEAIHEVDPCLPCSSAPPGAMDLAVDVTRN